MFKNLSSTFCKLSFGAALLSSLFCSTLFAQSFEGVEFQRIPKNRKLRLLDCDAVDGFKRILASTNGIELPKRAKRGAVKLPKGAKFIACVDNAEGADAIYTRRRRLQTGTTALDSDTQVLNLSLESFPDDLLSLKCKQINSWPSWLIYKKIGSSHIPNSDPRRFTSALIGRGAPVSGGTCLDMLDSDGNVVAKFGRYLPDNGYTFRNYTAFGCGQAKNGRAISDEAFKNTGSRDAYAIFGNSCFGPIDPQFCRNSTDKQC
jgi:hypothetical protein